MQETDILETFRF